MSDGAEIPAWLGESMGLGRLAWSEKGVLALQFETDDRLFLERRDREQAVLIYLARPIGVGADVEAILLRALRLCHEARSLPPPVHAALGRGDRLLFLLRLPFGEATPPVLVSAIDRLTELQQRAFAA